MANPSGKLWIASPVATTKPVFSKELEVVLEDKEMRFLIKSLQRIIIKIPIIIPKIQKEILINSKASGIKSKHIIEVIRPSSKL